MVVDVQNDFADPAGSPRRAGGSSDRADRERARSRERGARERPSSTRRTGIQHDTPHFEKDGGIWPVHCVRETWGAAFHPGLDVIDECGGPQGRRRRGRLLGVQRARPVERRASRDTVLDATAARPRERSDSSSCGLATDYCVVETVADARTLASPSRCSPRRSARSTSAPATATARSADARRRCRARLGRLGPGIPRDHPSQLWHCGQKYDVPLRDLDRLDRRPAPAARQPLAAVDLELVLVLARLAEQVDVRLVLERRAAQP